MNNEPARWDATVEGLLAYAQGVRYDALSPAVVHETKRRVIDTFASALGAYAEPVSVMSRALAARTRSDQPARVWGSEIVTTPELAAFANGVMVRSLDVSDTYLGRSRGHPSDMTPGLIALAEVMHADGKALIEAISLAYDIYCSFCQAVDVNAKGWDQPLYTVLGCALGAARLLRLDAEATGHALSLALTPNMALAQARRGSLSSWKGCAGANATRNAVFAALDALDEIAEIHAEGYGAAVFMMGADASRWAPATRETADHSLPYCIAIALLDGAVTSASFAAARLHDPAVVALMQKVKVSEDPALSARYPEGAPGRVTIRLKSGATQWLEIRYPRGHEKNPMSDAEIEQKFHTMCAGRLDSERRTAALALLRRLETVGDVSAVTALFAVA